MKNAFAFIFAGFMLYLIYLGRPELHRRVWDDTEISGAMSDLTDIAKNHNATIKILSDRLDYLEEKARNAPLRVVPSIQGNPGNSTLPYFDLGTVTPSVFECLGTNHVVYNILHIGRPDPEAR